MAQTSSAARRGSVGSDILSDIEDVGDEIEEVFDGKIKLFDGPKTYPIQKIEVDYMFVEHLDFNCIEIIGKSQERQLEAPRLYIKAEELYSKVEADKKTKDKKNRRTEQVISKKIIRNMAVQTILVRLNIDRSSDFALKLTAFDGVNFQIPQPTDLVPHVINERVFIAEQRRRSRSQSIEFAHRSATDMLAGSRGSMEGRHSSIIGSINLMPEGVGIAASAVEIHEALEDLEEDAADLNIAAEHAKEQSNLFVNTIENIKEMFDFRQKWREDNGDPNKKTGLKKKRVLRNGRPVEMKTEEHRKKHKEERYSLTVQPQEGMSQEQAQVVGREGPGGGPLTMIVGHSRHAAKTVSAGAAKAVLSAAGFVASNLVGKKVIAIGGKELKVVPKYINRRASSALVGTSNQAMSMLKKLGGSFRGLGSRDGDDGKEGSSRSTTPVGARQKVIDDLKASSAVMGGGGGGKKKSGGDGRDGRSRGGGGGGSDAAGDGVGESGPRRRNSDSQSSVLTKQKIDLNMAEDGGMDTPLGSHYNDKERAASAVSNTGTGTRGGIGGGQSDATDGSGNGNGSGSRVNNQQHPLFNAARRGGGDDDYSIRSGGGEGGRDNRGGGGGRTTAGDDGGSSSSGGGNGGTYHDDDGHSGSNGYGGGSSSAAGRNRGSHQGQYGGVSDTDGGGSGDASGVLGTGTSSSNHADAYGAGGGSHVGDLHQQSGSSGGGVKRDSLGSIGGAGDSGAGIRTPERRGSSGQRDSNSSGHVSAGGSSSTTTTATATHATTTASYTVKTSVGLKINPRKSLTGDPGVSVSGLVLGNAAAASSVTPPTGGPA